MYAGNTECASLSCEKNVNAVTCLWRRVEEERKREKVACETTWCIVEMRSSSEMRRLHGAPASLRLNYTRAPGKLRFHDQQPACLARIYTALRSRLKPINPKTRSCQMKLTGPTEGLSSWWWLIILYTIANQRVVFSGRFEEPKRSWEPARGAGRPMDSSLKLWKHNGKNRSETLCWRVAINWRAIMDCNLPVPDPGRFSQYRIQRTCLHPNPGIFRTENLIIA